MTDADQHVDYSRWRVGAARRGMEEEAKAQEKKEAKKKIKKQMSPGTKQPSGMCFGHPRCAAGLPKSRRRFISGVLFCVSRLVSKTSILYTACSRLSGVPTESRRRVRNYSVRGFRARAYVDSACRCSWMAPPRFFLLGQNMVLHRFAVSCPGMPRTAEVAYSPTRSLCWIVAV